MNSGWSWPSAHDSLSAMLNALTIRDFAIIDQAELALSPGLTVLTGETGAGKSILVDAVKLVLGGKGDATVVREGAERAEFGAEFELKDRPEASAWLTEQALDANGECQLRRVIQKDGRSRGFINGRPAPMQSLRELGEYLVELHGQHEHQSLLRRSAQLRLLDRYAGNRQALARVASHFARCRSLQEKLAALPESGESLNTRLDYLEHQINELESLALGANELKELEAEQQRLAHGNSLSEAGALALDTLDGDDDMAVCARLARIEHEIDTACKVDANLQAVAGLLKSALIESQEAVNEVRHYLDALDLDPARLEAVEQRLGAAHDLARKHRVAMTALSDVLDEFKREADDLRNTDQRRQELQDELDHATKAYLVSAKKLSQSRSKAASRLNEDVTGLMKTLGMRDGSFVADVQADFKRSSAQGVDSVEFLVNANPGQSPRPLRKVASGGELSRIALAIQVATVSLGGERTLIFDEVDAGSGGAVAEIVGAKLRELGAAGQALCVTHLPQVAAQGHNHLQILKSVDGQKTQTEAVPLDDLSARSHEIARMLGGVRLTDKTRAHAREMLEKSSAGG